MNEIEARQEEYSETLSFIHLVNTLMETLSGALAGGAVVVAHYTQFVLQQVLPYLWQRGYR